MIAVLAAVRWLHEASLMALFGSAMLAVMLRRRLPALAVPRQRWREIAAPLAAVSALLWFVFAAAQMAGDPGAMGDPHLLWLAASQTLFGQLFLVRLALLILLCGSVLLGWRESVNAAVSGAALVLISVTSHAAEASPAHFTAIGATSDGLHLLTGGFWVGGLALLAILFARRGENSLLAASDSDFRRGRHDRGDGADPDRDAECRHHSSGWRGP